MSEQILSQEKNRKSKTIKKQTRKVVFQTEKIDENDISICEKKIRRTKKKKSIMSKKEMKLK